MRRSQLALGALDLTARGLEIGPSHNPLVRKADGYQVETVDHAPREELVKKYRAWGVPQEQLDDIEEVDHLWAGGPLSTAVPELGVYEYIVASHFIEHAIDFIGLLQDCERLLTPSGRLSLAVPDKRYTFDRFKSVSSLGDVIDAAHSPYKFHPPGPLVDHFANACLRGGGLAWSADSTQPLSLQRDTLDDVAGVEAIGVDQREYFDVHRWRFTPTSFALLIEDLAELARHGLEIVAMHDIGGFEFFVTLGRRQSPFRRSRSRLEALLKIEDELSEDSGRAQRENDELRVELARVLQSRSWRLLRPARAAGRLARRVLGR